LYVPITTQRRKGMGKLDIDLTAVSIIAIVCLLAGSVAYIVSDYNKTQIGLVAKAPTCEIAVILSGVNVDSRLAICRMGSRTTVETTKAQ
jgi:hypothetical protein